MTPAHNPADGPSTGVPPELQEKIFFGLKEYFSESVGVREPFTLDDRIDEVLKREGLWNDIDLADVAFGLQLTFGFKYSLEEWSNFFGFNFRSPEEWERSKAPQFTFRTLLAFIAARMEPVSCEPARILGRPCATAGAFRALEKLVVSIRTDVVRFGPSTPIHSVLNRREQQRLWTRLRWLTGGKLPRAASRLRQNALLCLFLGAILSGVCLIGFGVELFLGTKGLLPLRTALSVFLGCAFGVWLLFPGVPKEIVTFGDLSKRVAETMEQAESSPAQ